MGERTRLLSLLTAALVVAGGLLPGSAAAQGGVPAGCPATFQVLNGSTRTFTRGSGGSAGFSVAPATTPSGGGGGHHPHGAVCPGTFQVLHNDRIGSFAVPAGSHTITLLGARRLRCGRA